VYVQRFKFEYKGSLRQVLGTLRFLQACRRVRVLAHALAYLGSLTRNAYDWL